MCNSIRADIAAEPALLALRLFVEFAEKAEVSVMTDEIFYIEDGAEVAPPAWDKPGSRYGTVPDLPEEELAGLDELERMVFRQEWGPVLALPVKGSKSGFRRSVDEDGRVDFGAFATVDFERYAGEFDKARYKADKLKEKLRDLVIMVQIINERIPGKAKYKILKLVREGVLDADDIKDWDVWQLALNYVRAVKLKQEIRELQERSWRRRQEKLRAWLES